MVTVRFYGSLKQFGTQFELDCQDTAEVLRALCHQIKGFRQHIQQGFYKVRIGKEYLDNRYLDKGLFYKLKDGMTVHFTPVLKGAKKAGVFQAVLGVALVAGALLLGPVGWGALGSTSAMMMGAMGASMLLGGVAQMLTKTPSMSGGLDDKEKKSSTAFGGIQNMSAQGQVVPLAYGRIMCGSMIVSQGIETFDAETQKEEIEKKKRKSRFNK
ncbi:TPA: tail assembly protein [Mannheimia haemolytica]|uniref:tail assembly protein n=1 Tax=Mannheimia haemolytica TaxID=75985 RepID=UPI00059D1B88|nr:tail assembly protein [Mannheimia haemolytica]AGI35723.2 tail assembly protein [Mannheimia haemolytica USDA-ARS-USMARC-185]